MSVRYFQEETLDRFEHEPPPSTFFGHSRGVWERLVGESCKSGYGRDSYLDGGIAAKAAPTCRSYKPLLHAAPTSVSKDRSWPYSVTLLVNFCVFQQVKDDLNQMLRGAVMFTFHLQRFELWYI